MTDDVKKRQIVDVPLAHYKALYAESDAWEIAARTGLLYDAEAKRFTLRLIGAEYRIGHPAFTIEKTLPSIPDLSPYEKILTLRYLLEGKYAPCTGAMLSYAEMPWGAVYISQFKGRVIGRIVREFGGDPTRLAVAVEQTSGLSFERTDGADAAYRFEVLNGLYVAILLWMGDDEFPASAQVLFSDNFKYAFTAEDIAVVGDVIVSRLKRSLMVFSDHFGGGV